MMIKNQNNIPTLEQQIGNEFNNVMQLLNTKQVKEANSAFEKLNTLLYELKRQNKAFVWQNWLNQINQLVQNLRNMNGIGNLQYIRFSTFIHNLYNFSKINEKDWNSRSMFYTQVADNGKFYPVQNGLENIGATCFMNATLQAMYNLSLFYDFIISWKNNIDAGNGKVFNQQSFYNYRRNEAGAQCMWQLLMLFSVLCNHTQNKCIAPTNFRNFLEVANPLFKQGQAGDSKDFIIYILEELHKVMKKPVSVFSNSLPPLNQYDRENTLSHFLSDFQKETSSISDNFFSISQTTTTCLYCKQVFDMNCQANPICYNYGIANLLIFPLEEVKNHKKNKEKLNGAENPVLSIKDCFDYYEKIDYFTGPSQISCNICKQLCDAHYQTKIYSLPKTLILLLNRGRGNECNCTIDYPIYLDCSDTNVIDEDQRCEFKYLNSVVRYIGQSMRAGEEQDGYGAHFISLNKSPKDGKWHCFNDALVSMIGDGSDEAALIENNNTNWNIKRSVQNYDLNDTVPYIVSYTGMTAEGMLDYTLRKVKDETYREAMRKKFYSLQYFTNRGDENRKRFAYLLMYAVAERRTAKVNVPKLTGLTEQEVSDLACATFEMLKHENNFLKPEKIQNVQSGRDGIDYYKSVIKCEAQAMENGRRPGKSWKMQDIIKEINYLHYVGQNGQGGRLSEHITIDPNDFEYGSGYPLQQVPNQTQQNNFNQMQQNYQMQNNFNNQYNNQMNNLNQNNFNNNLNQGNLNNNINNINKNNQNNINQMNNFNNQMNINNNIKDTKEMIGPKKVEEITVEAWINQAIAAYKLELKLSDDQKKRLEKHIVNNMGENKKLASQEYYKKYGWIIEGLCGKEGAALEEELGNLLSLLAPLNDKSEDKEKKHDNNQINQINNPNNNKVERQKEKEKEKEKENLNKDSNKNKQKQKEIERQQEIKKKENELEEKKENKTTTNINEANKQEQHKLKEEKQAKEKGQNNPIDIDNIVNRVVDNSKPLTFAAFCNELADKQGGNVDLSKLNFGPVKLGFINCFKAFFLTLFDGVYVNCGFWNRMCLRVFFENAKSKGASYCFEATEPEGSNNQSLNHNKDQYKKNIRCLSVLIREAQEKANEEPNLDKNNQNQIKQ